jgi:hypothetical protein
MPPRRSARLAADAAPNGGALMALPPALVLAVFSLLPVDARARCAAVCRAWHAALLEPSLWQHLDLSPTSGVTRPVTDALMEAAAARAGGTLRTLDISDVAGLPAAALLPVVAANAATLRELRAADTSNLYDRAFNQWPVVDVEALLHAAPLLRVVDATVDCGDLALACRMLRNEGIFEQLRVRCLYLHDGHEDEEGNGNEPAGEADVLALATAMLSHESLAEIILESITLDTAVKLDAVVQAALTHRLRAVWISNAGLTGASLPALVRLCGSSTLMFLCLDGGAEVLPDAPAAVALGNALRANRLTTLVLANLGIWRDPAVGTALLGALTGHPSLMMLVVSCMRVPAAHQAAAGAALGALVAANSPALHVLDASWSWLGDAGWGPLVDALPGNTHLRRLRGCDREGRLSEAFARDLLLPAVRANTSLRTLRTGLDWQSAVEAEDLVDRRGRDT